MEAEYIALTSAAKEGIWLNRLQRDLDVSSKGEILIYEDNQSTIKTAKNIILNDRSKHIDVHYHFIQEKVMEGIIKLKYCSTSEMTADVFTKPLQRVLHTRHILGLGLKDT